MIHGNCNNENYGIISNSEADRRHRGVAKVASKGRMTSKCQRQLILVTRSSGNNNMTDCVIAASSAKPFVVIRLLNSRRERRGGHCCFRRWPMPWHAARYAACGAACSAGLTTPRSATPHPACLVTPYPVPSRSTSPTPLSSPSRRYLSRRELRLYRRVLPRSARPATPRFATPLSSSARPDRAALLATPEERRGRRRRARDLTSLLCAVASSTSKVRVNRAGRPASGGEDKYGTRERTVWGSREGRA